MSLERRASGPSTAVLLGTRAPAPASAWNAWPQIFVGWAHTSTSLATSRLNAPASLPVLLHHAVSLPQSSCPLYVVVSLSPLSLGCQPSGRQAPRLLAAISTGARMEPARGGVLGRCVSGSWMAGSERKEGAEDDFKVSDFGDRARGWCRDSGRAGSRLWRRDDEAGSGHGIEYSGVTHLPQYFEAVLEVPDGTPQPSGMRVWVSVGLRQACRASLPQSAKIVARPGSRLEGS